MKIETPLVAMLLAGTLFVGLYTVMFSVADEYGANYDLTLFDSQNGTSINDAFDRINQTKTDIENIQDDFNKETLTDQGSGGLFSFLSLAFSVSRSALDSITLFDDLLYITSEVIGIPPHIVGALTSIVLITFIIVIIMILLGRTYGT